MQHNEKSGHHVQTHVLSDTLAACKTALVYALVIGFVTSLLILAPAIYSLQVLDRVISSGSLETLAMLTLIVLFALIFLHIMQAVRAFASTRVAHWLEMKLAPTVWYELLKHGAQSGGEISSQAVQDVGQIKQLISQPNSMTALDTPWSVIFISVLFLIHPYVGLLALFGSVGLVGLAWLHDKSSRKIMETVNQNTHQTQQDIAHSIRNSEVIIALGITPHIIQKWQTRYNENHHNYAIASDRMQSISHISRFLRFFLQVAITGLGGYLVLQAELTVGAMIASSIITGRVFAPFEAAINSWGQFINASLAYARLQELLQDSQDHKPMQLPEPKGNLSLSNVYFIPEGYGSTIIKNLSFELKSADILGVVGSSAAGKSTLAKLLIGIWYPSSGSVRLDNADITQWDRIELGKHIGYLPQDIELFDGSVKDNIARLDPQISANAVTQAAQFAGIHEMILALPQGYDTIIGSAGLPLSPGQKQRIGLARAFLGEPKLVVLDEPNSNLDGAGEIALTQAIKQAKKRGITVVIISHRPQIMTLTDKMLVLTPGQTPIFNDTKTMMQNMQKEKVL